MIWWPSVREAIHWLHAGRNSIPIVLRCMQHAHLFIWCTYVSAHVVHSACNLVPQYATSVFVHHYIIYWYCTTWHIWYIDVSCGERAHSINTLCRWHGVSIRGTHALPHKHIVYLMHENEVLHTVHIAKWTAWNTYDVDAVMHQFTILFLWGIASSMFILVLCATCDTRKCTRQSAECRPCLGIVSQTMNQMNICELKTLLAHVLPQYTTLSTTVYVHRKKGHVFVHNAPWWG
jgi:hypothetical protein